MSKAPRADIALLRKLKAAKSDPNCKPSELLSNGDDLLQRAQQLKGFLKKQNSRQDSVSAKTEWLLTYQKLQEEREAAEKEMITSMELGGRYDEAWIKDLLESAGDFHASSLDCKTTRHQLRSQMQNLTSVVRSLAAYGPEDLIEEMGMVWEEISTFSQQLCGELEELLEHFEGASSEVDECWPSALHPDDLVFPESPSQPPSRRSSVSSTVPDTPRPSSSGREGGGGSAEEEMDRLEALLGRYGLCRAEVADSVRAAYHGLRAQYVERLGAWRKDYNASWQGPGRSTGGWAAEEHSAFVRHYKEGMKEVEARGGKEGVLRRIATMLPGRSQVDVAKHESWYTCHKLLQRRYKDLKDGWARELDQFLQHTGEYLSEAQRLVVCAAEAAADRLEWEAIRLMKGEELDAQRQQRALELEASATRRAEQQAAAEALAAEEEARWRAEREAKKEQVERYRDDKERRRLEAAAAAERAAGAAADAAAAAAPVRQERVEFRKAEQQLRLEQQKTLQRRQHEEERAREARLQRLRDQVKPQVEADPARVLAPTACQLVESEGEGRAFHPVHGFTTEEVVRDARFKVTEALMAAGLHRTDYGRRVIAAALTAVPTRRDNLTTMQRTGP